MRPDSVYRLFGMFGGEMITLLDWSQRETLAVVPQGNVMVPVTRSSRRIPAAMGVCPVTRSRKSRGFEVNLPSAQYVMSM